MIKTAIIEVKLKVNVSENADVSMDEIVQELDYDFNLPPYLSDAGWDGCAAFIHSTEIIGFKEIE